VNCSSRVISGYSHNPLLATTAVASHIYSIYAALPFSFLNLDSSASRSCRLPSQVTSTSVLKTFSCTAASSSTVVAPERILKKPPLQPGHRPRKVGCQSYIPRRRLGWSRVICWCFHYPRNIAFMASRHSYQIRRVHKEYTEDLQTAP
jgi:hypothetical protein